MATTLGTIQILHGGTARLVDDLAKRGLTVTFTFTPNNDPAGGSIGTLNVTLPDSANSNASFGSHGRVHNSVSR